MKFTVLSSEMDILVIYGVESFGKNTVFSLQNENPRDKYDVIFDGENSAVFFFQKAWLNFTPPKLVLHFLEYSRNIPWNIPYSKIFNISLVYIFFWNIPGIFHIPNNSTFFLFQDFLEYSIFQKIQDFLCCKFFWNMT